ncbi:unnamed protein product, partial [Rotaria sp. Silwood1]
MFITRMEEFRKLPGEKIIFTALNRLLLVAGQNDWHSNYPDLEKQIATGLYKMSKQLIEAWILDIVSSDKLPIESVAALCKLLQQCERIVESEENDEKKKFLKTWINRDICTWLFKYFPNDTIENQFLVDAVLAKVAIRNSKVLPANDLRTLFTENQSCLIHLNLPVLAAIIALCGGLTLSDVENKKKRSGSQDYDGDMVTSARFAVVFSPQHMHRKSPLILELKKYIQATQNATGVDVQSDFAHQIQKKAEKIQLDDQTLEAVDTFILIFCIVGVDEFWLFRPFVHHKAFKLAINRFKGILNYLRQLYFIPEIYDRHDRSIISKESLLSNFDNFNQYMYRKYTINRDSTQLIDLFMKWQHTMNESYHRSSSERVETLFTFIDLISRGRARLCTSTRTSLTKKWLCKTDQTCLLLPKFFQKRENLKKLLGYTSTQPSLSDLSLSMFSRLLWKFNDIHHGTDIAEVIIHKAEYSMLFQHDKHHSYALAFVPKHLQLLFSRAINGGHIIIHHKYENRNLSRKSSPTLSFTHILCTSLLAVCNPTVTYACQSALVALLPLCRIYRLEHLVLALLCWTATISDRDPCAMKWYFEEMQRPTDDEHFSYTDHYDKLSEVNYPDISDEEVTDGVRLAIGKAEDRLQDVLERTKRERDRTPKTDAELSSALISLGYLCWSLPDGNEKELFEECLTNISKINDVVVRLDVLTVLALCPFICSSVNGSSDLNRMRSQLNELTRESFKELPNDMTPLLSVSFFDRYISLVGANDEVIDGINRILNQTDSLRDEDDKRAILIALGPCINLSSDLPAHFSPLMQRFPTSPILARAQVLQFDSPLLRQLVEDSKEKNMTKVPFLNDRDHSQSISVLYACMYLANLASDIQKLSILLNDHQLVKVNISRLSNKQIGLSEERQVLTYSHIVSINTKLNSLDTANEILSEITNLEPELHNFQECEPNAQSFLMKWLKYKTDSPRYVLTCHAALILGRSGVWTIDIAHIICDLLNTENDRFRQAAECLLHGNERKSSELGWDVLLIFIQRFISYETKSTYASLVLSWLFRNITIDKTKHFVKIIELEKQRTSGNNKYRNNEESSESREPQNLFESSSPIARWFIRFAPHVMEHFINYLKSFIADLPARRNLDRLKVTESQRQFVFGWCAQILSAYTNDVEIILNLLSNVLMGNFSSHTQCSAAYAIGHSSTEQAQEILLNIIQKKSETKATISEEVLAVCIHAYCWSCSSKKMTHPQEKQTDDDEQTDEEEKPNEDDERISDLCLEMLKHKSSSVQTSASIELAKICPSLEKLLEHLDDDSQKCYDSLVKVHIDRSDTKTLTKHSKGVAELIRKNPDLLEIYIIDLYKTIEHFQDQLEPYPEWSEEFGE